jgi:hypothetical protein
MKIEFEWEYLDDDCQRVKVIGGWVLRYRDIDDCNSEYTVASMVFISDPEHLWKVE